MSKFVDSIISGASFLLLGKELLDNSNACSRWKEMYDSLQVEIQAAKQEAKEAREEVRVVHGQYLEFLQMLQEVETSRSEIYRQYLHLVDTLEEMGIRVTEDGQILSPEVDQAEVDIFEDDEES